MSLPDVVSQDEWLAARKELLAREKELTRARDALNAERRQLPMVEIEKDYASRARTARRACSTCSTAAASSSSTTSCSTRAGRTAARAAPPAPTRCRDGLLAHLHARDTTLAYVSRAPLEKIERYKAEQGWTFPWYSSFGSDFNYDFHVTHRRVGRAGRVQLPHAGRARGARHGLLPGRRAADRAAGHELLPARRRRRVPHLLDLRAAAREMTGGSYYFLDLTALGRQEEWEEPKGRAVDPNAARPDFA